MPTRNTGKRDEKDRSSVGFEPEKSSTFIVCQTSSRNKRLLKLR